MKTMVRAFALMAVMTILASAAWAQQNAPAAPGIDPAAAAAAVDPTGAFVDMTPAGSVNWDNGGITAKGIGAPPPGAANPAQARGMAKRAATVIARRNLLELLRGVQIDSRTTVSNFMVANDIVVSRIQGFLQNSRILDTAYMSDGSVEVTVGIGLRGGLADVVLPQAPKFKPQAPAAAPAAPAASLGAYTGVIVDARGLGARPAMNPRILDETGVELYGTSAVGRSFAIKQGMAGYAKDLDKARGNSRVAGNPFVVQALSVAGRARTDLIIPNDKAEELRALSETGDLFGQARVMILLD